MVVRSGLRRQVGWAHEITERDVMNGESRKPDEGPKATKPYRIDVTCPTCHSLDCIRADRRGIYDFIRRTLAFPMEVSSVFAPV